MSVESPERSTGRSHRKRRCKNVAAEEELFAASMKNKKVHVKCNQTGKVFKVTVEALSLDNGQAVTERHLEKGTQLLLDYNSKNYPVTVSKVEDGHKEGVRKKARTKSPPQETSDITFDEKENDTPRSVSGSSVASIAPSGKNSAPPSTSPSSLLDHESDTEKESDESGEDSDGSVIELAKESFSKVTAQSPIPMEGKDCVMNELKQIRIELDSVNKKLDQLCKADTGLKMKSDPEFVENGIDLLSELEEQSKSVVLKTKKSEKPPLSPPRVRKMFNCVSKRYPSYDHKALMASLGQKCRDANRDSKKNK